jgi:hypothetical protein
MSTVILIILAAAILCTGFLFGGIYTTIFSAVSAVIATIALINAIMKWRKSNK